MSRLYKARDLIFYHTGGIIQYNSGRTAGKPYKYWSEAHKVKLVKATNTLNYKDTTAFCKSYQKMTKYGSEKPVKIVLTNPGKRDIVLLYDDKAQI